METERIKYTIAGVQQSKLMELDLDIKDASIITYLRDFIASEKLVKKNVDGELYYWVDGNKLLNYLPALKINSTTVLGRRYKVYEKLGLIKRHVHRNPLMGSYTFIKPETEFYNLFEVTKVMPTNEELKNEYEKLGLEFIEPTQKSSRRADKKPNEIKEEITISRNDSKVSSSELKSCFMRTQKLFHNTPNSNTPNNNTKAVVEKKEKTPTAANFEIQLKKELKNININSVNKNTVSNIKKYSNSNIATVKKAIAHILVTKKSKLINLSILVAVLRDKDYETPITQSQELSRTQKIKIMKKRLGIVKVQEMKARIIHVNGFEAGANTELGTRLCQMYNQQVRNEN